MKKKVLLLDIDYTVINTDSMIDFLKYSLKIKPIKTIRKIPYIFITLIMHALKIKSLKEAKEAVFSPIVNFSEYELQQFFKKELKPKINKSMKEIIQRSKEEDMFVLMITASPYAYMKYFKTYGYADEVIGTDLVYIKQKYKNEIIGKNCKGYEKVVRINKLLNELQIEIDKENSFAYSDSKSDLEMFNLVDNAYLVTKKNGEVKEIIKENKYSTAL